MKQTNTENLKKRGKKGGTRFPRYSLEHLITFLKSLASKTHTNTITIEQLNAGVFGIGSQSDAGKIKYSALKQFGLLDGDYTKIKATDLASKIAMADGEERTEFLNDSLNKVSVFVNALKTFQNSRTEKIKIAQYAVSSLKVHPDMKDDFVEIFTESAKAAGLCSIEGNSVNFSEYTPTVDDGQMDNDEPAGEIVDEEETNVRKNGKQNGNVKYEDESSQTNSTKKQGQVSNINVSIDVDPSMDPEKLEKLLKLLKNYGAI